MDISLLISTTKVMSMIPSTLCFWQIANLFVTLPVTPFSVDTGKLFISQDPQGSLQSTFPHHWRR